MPNFFVRTIEGHEAVGFFAVEDFDDLLHWIDECTDPSVCEYAEIRSGSIIWPGAAMKVPNPDYDWDREKRSLLAAVGKYDLGGYWGDALFDENLVFTPCFEDALTSAANDA